MIQQGVLGTSLLHCSRETMERLKPEGRHHNRRAATGCPFRCTPGVPYPCLAKRQQDVGSGRQYAL